MMMTERIEGVLHIGLCDVAESHNIVQKYS